MESQDETSDVPPWVAPALDKMKAEICAEITARVAYSVRLMLDKNLEDIKDLLTEKLLSPPPQFNDQAVAAVCHDCAKKKLKKEEKEEKKRENQAFKEEKRAKKTEKLFKKMEKSYKHKMGSLMANVQQELCSGEAQSLGLEERKKSVNFDDGEDKPANARPKLELPVFGYATVTESEKVFEKDILPSSCDSEFEVVSMPSQTTDFHFVQGNTDDSLLASSEDELYENAVEENAVSSTMTESTLSVATIKSLHDEDKATGPQEEKQEERAPETNGLLLERSRTPYHQNSGEVIMVDMVEDVGNEDALIQDSASAPEPPPPEAEAAAASARGESSSAILLERERAPYSSAGSSGAPRRSRDTPHIDILPENLWKGAVSVAAQAYNAARTVVGDLGGVRGQGGHVYQAPRDPREELLQQLHAMGFQNRSRNIQLLERYNNNMDNVIEALLA